MTTDRAGAPVPPHDPHTSCVVIANAGAGKTHTLTSRVARLLVSGADPDSILCLTYTKAAATEMRARLFGLLGDWATADDETLRQHLARLEDRNAAAESYDAATLRRSRTLFARALETPGGLRIQTLHAFAEHVLHRFPLEAGLTPGFAILDETDAARLRQQTLKRLAHTETPEDFAAFSTLVAHLNEDRLDQTLQALFAQRDRIAAAITQAESLEALLTAIWHGRGFTIPTTPDAEWRAGIDQADIGALKAALTPLKTGTASTEKNTAPLLGQMLDETAPSAQRLAAFQALMLTTKGEIRTSKLCTKPFAKAHPEAAEALQNLQALGRDTAERAFRAHTALMTTASLRLAHRAHVHYQAAKRAQGVVDFDDMIAATARLLSTAESAQWVLYKLDGEISHVLVDEAQDTAPPQWQMIAGLTSEFFAGAGRQAEDRPRTLFAVGDLKQSIYSFQGAEPLAFLEASQDYEARATASGHPWQRAQLGTSYRTVPEVLRFVDAVLALPGAQTIIPETSMGPEDNPHKNNPHTAVRTHAGRVEVWSALEPPPRGQPPHWQDPLDQVDEQDPRLVLADQVARTVAARLHNHTQVFSKDGDPRAATPGDIMILLQNRGPLFTAILDALRAHGVPVAGADRLQVFQTLAVQDLVRLARVGLMPRDDLTLAELLRSPVCDVDEDSLFALAYGREGSLWSALATRHAERPDWQAAYDLVQWAISAAPRQSAFAFFYAAVFRQDPEGYTIWQRLCGRLGPETEDALQAFLAHAQNSQPSLPPGLHPYLELIDSTQLDIKREFEHGADAVRVMTVHGAKGLEAPIVIVPDSCRVKMGKSSHSDPYYPHPDMGLIWPHKQDPDAKETITAFDDASYAEYLRLGYVAFTRARDQLIICGTWPRNMGKDKRPLSWMALAQDALNALHDQGVPVRVETHEDQTMRILGADVITVPTPKTSAETSTPTPAPEWLTPSSEPVPPPALHQDEPTLSPLLGVDRFRRGRLIHSLLALLPDVPQADWAQQAERVLTQEPELSAEQRQEIFAATHSVLTHPECAAAFGPDSRAEVPIAGVLPNVGYIEGRLDRLVRTDVGYRLIEFKTNRPAPKTQIPDAYWRQLRRYVQLLQAAEPGVPIEAVLIWTDGPRVVRLRDKDILAHDQTLNDAPQQPTSEYI